MKKPLRILCFSLILSTVGCVTESGSPIESSNNAANIIRSGDIVVVNTPNDSIILLDADGNFKATLVNEDDPASVILGWVSYDSVDKRLLFTFDHATNPLDELREISLYNGRVETVINNANLAGTLAAAVRLTGGDYVITESANQAEKFNANRSRVATAPFATAFLVSNNVQIDAMANGGFLACASGTGNTVRTYNAAGTLGLTATSASPGPSLGAMGSSGCVQRPDGTIVVAYSGTTDTVRAYTSNLGTVLWDYSDTTILPNPGRVAVRPNGNILVTDLSYNHIVELTSAGAFLRVIGGSALSTAGAIEVIP